jgi:restriction system protein
MAKFPGAPTFPANPTFPTTATFPKVPSFPTAPLQDPDLPQILLQAVLDKGAATDEGTLILAVTPAWHMIVQQLLRNPNDMFLIPPRTWEEMIAGAYREAGFDNVILTPRSGDLGRDVIAEKSGWGCVRFIDQVKAYKPGHLVTAEEVRALGFVLGADQAATKGVVTTTSTFAPRIVEDRYIKPYLPTRLELIDGTQLIQRLSALVKE